MERAELEKNGLTKEQVDFVMAENGKDIKAEQEKAKTAQETAIAAAVKPLNEQIGKHAEQVKELEDKIKSSDGVDEKSKGEIAELQKAHAKALKDMDDNHKGELAKLRREAETREFFSGLPKKFITPETQKAFEQRVNEALTDKTYEGKNRADILAMLSKGEDGKERTDIYAVDTTVVKPNATGGTGDPPAGGAGGGEQKKAPPKII